jgi:hypothetical protein
VLRDFVDDIADSALNKSEELYDEVRALRPSIGDLGGLKTLVTSDLSTGTTMVFRDTTGGNILRVYELVAGTAAESSPEVLRPNDYAATINEKIWRLALIPMPTGTVESVTGDGVDNTDTANPVISYPSPADIGLGSVNNTTDSSKPVSTAQSAAIAAALATAQSYADGLVVGLLDDRGNYDASTGAYPSSGGSGTAGAILKGDLWTISVGGTLPTGQVVTVGDVIRALVNTPGNTQANWVITQNNLTYVPENSANKGESGGYVGLSGFSIAFKNLANTFTSLLQNAATAIRTYTFQDRSYTVAGTDDFIGVQDIPIPASAFYSRLTNPNTGIGQPSFGSNNFLTHDFPSGSQTYVQFSVPLPRNWNNGTITAKIYWSAAAGTVAQNVRFTLAAVAFSDNDALNASMGTAQNIDDALQTLSNLHITPASPAITIGGSPASEDLILFELSRVGTGSDTLASAVRVHSVSIRITTSSGKAA